VRARLCLASGLRSGAEGTDPDEQLRAQCRFGQRPSTTSIPRRIKSSCCVETRPTRSVSHSRSRATICDTLATESFGSLVLRRGISTFPGASANRRLLVSGTQTIVAIRLRLKLSPCTTTTGRRRPGSDANGAGRSAQQMSPRATTTRRAPELFGRPPSEIGIHHPSRRQAGREIREYDPARGVPDTLRVRRDRVDSGSGSDCSRGVPPPRKDHREEISRFSYPQYNLPASPEYAWRGRPRRYSAHRSLCRMKSTFQLRRSLRIACGRIASASTFSSGTAS
jgi:hypothetical protein